MQPDPHERALAVFEAFLRFARDPSTSITGRGPAPTRAGASARPTPPRSNGGLEPLDAETRPSLHAPPPDTSPETASPPADRDAFDEPPTRESQLSAAMASSLAPLREDANLWDEPTQERPEVSLEILSRARRAAQSPPPPVAAVAARFDPMQDALPERRTVIVDEDAALTEPTFGPDKPAVRSVISEARAEAFVNEMTVLIKYGHADQVPRELERWIRTYPDELGSHVLLAEFELTRVDAASGLDRLFAIASRALDRGERGIAARVLERVLRDAPGDLRVTALRDRVGRGG